MGIPLAWEVADVVDVDFLQELALGEGAGAREPAGRVAVAGVPVTDPVDMDFFQELARGEDVPARDLYGRVAVGGVPVADPDGEDARNEDGDVVGSEMEEVD